MKILKTLLLIMLYIFLLILVLLIGAIIFIAPILLLQWSYWQSGLFLGSIVLGIFLICAFLAWMRRRRERKFVQQVIDEDESAIQQQPDHERDGMRSMQQSWTDAIRTLQRSKLRRRGNPLYVLPWYMVIGDPDSGKSSAARGSRLMSSIGGVQDSARLGSANPCEWWFLDNSILLDVNGRYTLGDETETREWFQFLDQLAKYRVREPIDGVIVTVPVDLLLGGSNEAIADYGRRIRQRLDSLIRKLGHRFPVYMMLTKADHLLGMNDFLSLLPDKTLEQGMGALNERLDDAPEIFIEQALDNIAYQMRDLRLLMLHRYQRKYPDLMCLPDEVVRLRGGLNAFTRAAFQENPYQIAPQLRGLFLSSAKREGAPKAQRLHDLGLPEEAPAKPSDVGEPAFLQDFFGQILPRDRGLYTPVPEFLRFQQLSRNIGFLALLCVGVTLCLLMSASFLKTRVLLRNFSKQVDMPKTAQAADSKSAPANLAAAASNANDENALLISVNEINKLRNNIASLDTSNQALWWTTPFMLNHSRTLEARMKQYYVGQFHDRVINAIDTSLENNNNVRAVGVTSRANAAYFEWLVRRTNLTRLGKSGDISEKTFKQSPAPSNFPLRIAAPVFEEPKGQDLATEFPAMYRLYYLWNHRPDFYKKEHLFLYDRLVKFANSDQVVLQNVVTWANAQDTLTDITMQQFWGQQTAGQNKLPNAIIERAHTNVGKEACYQMIAQFREALLEYDMPADEKDRLKQYVDGQTAGFGGWYKQVTFAEWLNFARMLPEGMYSVRNEQTMRQVAADSASLQGPYWNFIRLASTQLPALVDNNVTEIKAMPWVQLLVNMRLWLSKAPITQMYNDSGWIQSLTKFGKKIDQAANKTHLNIQLNASGGVDPASLFVQYQQAVKKLTPVAGARENEFKITKLFYSTVQGSAGKSSAAPAIGQPVSGAEKAKTANPFKDSLDAYDKLIQSQGLGGDDTQIVWRLFRGPVEFNLYYGSWESAMYLQQSWTTDIFSQVQTVPREQVPTLLFDKKTGLVRKFVDDKAASFLGQNAKGYYPLVAPPFNIKLPFLDTFISSINKGFKGSWGIQDSYTIDVRGLPTDVNQRAREMPYAVVLSHQTAKGTTRLKNLNYPVSETFTWKMAEGGDVQLQIQFIGVTLIKNYGGKYGMVNFAYDFENGSKTFTPADFPQSKDLLEGLGVKWVKVSFAFNQDQINSLVLLRTLLSLDVPENIVRDFGTLEGEVKSVPAAKPAGASTANPKPDPSAPQPKKPATQQKPPATQQKPPATQQKPPATQQESPPPIQVPPPATKQDTQPPATQQKPTDPSTSKDSQTIQWELVPTLPETGAYYF